MVDLSCCSPFHHPNQGSTFEQRLDSTPIARPLVELGLDSARSPRLEAGACNQERFADDNGSPVAASASASVASREQAPTSVRPLRCKNGQRLAAVAATLLLLATVGVALLERGAAPLAGPAGVTSGYSSSSSLSPWQLAASSSSSSSSSSARPSTPSTPSTLEDALEVEGFQPRPAFDDFRLAVRRADSDVGPATTTAPACPCANVSLCQTPLVQHDKEIFGFASSPYWPSWDWSKITTVAWSRQPEMICQAHAVGARVIAAAPPILFSDSAEARKAWIDDLIASLKENFLDGVTFDYENPMSQTPGSPTYQRMQQYRMLINETTIALHAAIPGSQISVCAAWSPANIDGRNYDYKALADASDLTYIMGYDTQSQIFGRCVASANAPLAMARYGAQLYLNLGIPKEKLIMGTPWYGYAYPCLNSGPEDTYCSLSFKPFRGVNCSDAIGRQFSFRDIMNLFDHDICPATDFAKTCKVTTPLLWDESTQSPYFNMVNEAGALYQFWFDNAASSALKYRVARDLGLRGVGPYRFDSLDPSDTPNATAQAAAMWEAFETFLE